MPKSYKVIFDGGSRGGDYDGYDFGVAEESNDTNLWITVQVSRDVVKEWTKNMPAAQLPGIAAKAVEQYLLGMVPGSALTAKSESAVRLALKTTTWYPGQPGRPEIVENWNEFDVEVPKPPLGFKRVLKKPVKADKMAGHEQKTVSQRCDRRGVGAA